MIRPLIIALDVENRENMQELLKTLPKPLFVKVGMELFYSEGPAVIEQLKDEGHQVFLDLKLHDIPNTVKRAMRQLATLGVDIVNVHVAGGTNMMATAREGLEAGTVGGRNRPKLIGVTQLTSTNEAMLQKELLIQSNMNGAVSHYARLAKEAGLDGVVSSAQEVPIIHEHCGPSFLTVTPGIRLKEDDKGDQTRIVTPEEARTLGSWAIVVGRSITAAPDPAAAYEIIRKQWEG